MSEDETLIPVVLSLAEWTDVLHAIGFQAEYGYSEQAEQDVTLALEDKIRRALMWE